MVHYCQGPGCKQLLDEYVYISVYKTSQAVAAYIEAYLKYQEMIENIFLLKLAAITMQINAKDTRSTKYAISRFLVTLFVFTTELKKNTYCDAASDDLAVWQISFVTSIQYAKFNVAVKK